jgi:DNA-binding CsgD family transcriptional regulator
MHITPRQGQILDLAAIGMSDKEIARRLGVSHSTVRTHLENFFRDQRVRNRYAAVTLWLRSHSPRDSKRPADECPYPKPFPPNFKDCVAYQPMEIVSLSISLQPLGRIWGCRHMAARQRFEPGDGWYAACLIGDAESRQRWAGSLGRNRLRKIGALQHQIEAASHPLIDRLWSAKNRQLQASSLGGDDAGPRPEMQALAAQLQEHLASVLEEHKEDLDAVHLPVKACMRLIRDSLDRLIDDPLPAGDWRVSDETLAMFPEDVRALLKPSSPREASRPELAGQAGKPRGM